MRSYSFFAGKGGVGKTSCAAATALREAERGHDVLLVSVDPAHSLADALGVPLGAEPRELRVRGRGRLRALELDADAALSRWLDERRASLRTIAERGTYLDASEIDRLFELSLPGVDELVALIEVERLCRAHEPERVLVDMAPTGHALRMLEMPSTLRQIARVLDGMQEKHRVIASALSGAPAAEDAADRLIRELEDQARALAAQLRDRVRARVWWVALPERLSIEETRDGTGALRAAGIAVDRVVVNRVTPPPPGPCVLCDPQRAAQRAAIEALIEESASAVHLVPCAAREPRGLAALRSLGAALERADRGAPLLRAAARRRRHARALRAGASAARPEGAVSFRAAERLELVLFTGKGGVGKTSCAAAAAIAIAERHPERRVLLLSIDPAHSIGDALAIPIGDRAVRVASVRGRLDARELDAAAELARRKRAYADAVDRVFDALRGGSRLDATYDRAVTRDLIELAPPGIDELVATLALLDRAARPPPAEAGAAIYDHVVVDTAPWGHTERWLEMPAHAREWVRALLAILLRHHRALGLGELASDLLELARGLGRLLDALHDGSRAQVVAVTRPAELPRLETARLARSLAALGLEVASVVVNAVRLDEEGTCERCRAERRREHLELARLRRDLGPRGARMVAAPLRAEPPRGVDALRAWAARWAPLGTARDAPRRAAARPRAARRRQREEVAS